MIDKIARWFFCGVLIALVPLAYSYINLLMKSEPVTFSKTVNRGELLIIVWTLCAGAIGELFGNNQTHPTYKIVSGGLCTVVLVSSALLFASISEARISNGRSLNDTIIMTASLVLLVMGLITCASCIALSEI